MLQLARQFPLIKEHVKFGEVAKRSGHNVRLTQAPEPTFETEDDWFPYVAGAIVGLMICCLVALLFLVAQRIF